MVKEHFDNLTDKHKPLWKPNDQHERTPSKNSENFQNEETAPCSHLFQKANEWPDSDDEEDTFMNTEKLWYKPES